MQEPGAAAATAGDILFFDKKTSGTCKQVRVCAFHRHRSFCGRDAAFFASGMPPQVHYVLACEGRLDPSLSFPRMHPLLLLSALMLLAVCVWTVQMGAIRSPAVNAEWSPDGRQLLISTVAPRLRVDNKAQVGRPAALQAVIVYPATPV